MLFRSHCQKNGQKIMEKKTKKGAFKFIDLFAGIGGIRIAFERTGNKCVFTSEWDKDAQKTYSATSIFYVVDFRASHLAQ